MANLPARRRPSGPALWAGLVVVALLVLTSTLGRPLAVPSSGGASWLPPDGQRQRFAGPDGVQATEWAVDTAAAMIGSGPPLFATWLGVTKVDWQQAQLARLTRVLTTPDGRPGGRSDNLFSLGADGVHVEVENGFDGASRIYVPGRLDLPNDLVAGRSWTSEGAVLVIDSSGERNAVGYRAEYTASPPADRALIARTCLVIRMDAQVGTEPAIATERTWCRGAGFIGWAVGADRWQPAPPAGAVPAAPDAPFDWSTADRLSFEPRQINVLGAGTTLVSAISAPGLLPDGTAVFANTVNGDVIALQTGTDPPPSVWRARPGVRNTAAATFGTTTVVATVNRRLVAYGPDGAWLWDSALPDLAIVAPARLGDLVVTGTLDGSVTAYDLTTGTIRWQQSVGSEVRVAPQVAGGRVLVIDQGGQLSCFGADGATVWTAAVGAVEHFGVTTGDHPVVVVPNSDGPRVTGLSLADGTELWRPRQALTSRDVVALDDVVVLRDEDETIGIDPATGEKVWGWREERSWGAIGGGNRVLLLTGTSVVLLDGSGAKVTEWPVSIGDPSGSTTWLAAAQGRILVLGPKGAALGVAP